MLAMSACTGSGAATGAGTGTGTAAAPGTGSAGAGTARLTGVIVDATGAPVGEATVRSGPASTATDANGRFALGGLAAGSQAIAIAGDEILDATIDVTAPATDLRIAVARRIAIVGRVLAGDQPVHGATVELAGDAIAGRRRATSGADGGFAFDPLPEGTYQVWAADGERAARTVRVARLGARGFAPVVLKLDDGETVTGRVVDRDTGAGIAAAVELRALDRGEVEAARYVRTSADGGFTIAGVPRGRWAADAWSPGWITAGSVELDAGRGDAEVELVAGGVIDGTVVDAAGAPIAGASVHAMAGQGTRYGADDALETLRRFSGLSPAAIAPIAHTSAPARDARFVPRGELGVMLGPIPYPPITPEPAPVLPDDAIVAHVVGVDADPDPLAGDPARAPIWVTGADGRFRITGIADGTVTVFAAMPGKGEAASEPIDAVRGDRTTVVITLAR